MDFITDLPLSEGSDAVLIIIDRLTKRAHFVPSTKDMNARQFQETFMREIFRLHGLPRDIITDRGSIFTSDLWKETTKKLGIERRLSTAFHPQTDGQTEQTNSTLEQYLRAYVNYQQDNWKELLPMAEFAYNNGYQESTKHTPFFANYGTNPEYQAIGHLIQGKTTSPEDMSQLHDTLQAEMTEAQIRHKEYYDAQRKPDPNIKQGDMVWLLPRNIRTTRPCKKLDYKKIGPFKILAKIGTSAYKLNLPTSMRIHNTFYISLLELYNNNKLPSQRSEARLLSSSKENQNTNSEKSSTDVCITTSTNTELSAQGIHQNTTKPGTPPTTSKMQTSQSRTSTSGTQTSRTSIKLEEQENGDVLVSVSQNQEEAPPRPPKTPTPQENWGTTIGLPEMTPTSPPYRSPSAWEEAARRQKEHDALHWTGCYNDNCWVHDSEQVARGW